MPKPRFLDRQSEEALSNLKEALSYNPETGIFTWVKPHPNAAHFKKPGERAGGIMGKGYETISYGGVAYLSHRLAWAFTNDSWPKAEVDHKNHNKLDNRISNLRAVTHSENSKNKKLSSTNKSGFPGVFWSAKDKKWQTSICVDYKQIFLGYFDEIEEAISMKMFAIDHYNFQKEHGDKYGQ